MKQTRILSVPLALLLLLAFALSLFGCSSKATPEQVQESASDFSVRLFQSVYQGDEKDKNVLLSPLSVIAALAMATNGAKGETLDQMEKVLGLTVDELNDTFRVLLASLPQGEKYKLQLANSVWFTSDGRITVNEDFLATLKDSFRADTFRAPFDDDSTLREINAWVKDKTDGMIEKILDEIPEDALMYLINALAFDAEWETLYKESQVRDGTFTREDGTPVAATFLSSTESRFLDDGKATGFIKPYAGGKYAFVALLPNEGISLSDYVAWLDGDALSKTLTDAKEITVFTSIPKFEVNYSIELRSTLNAMGMTAAFDAGCADFSGLGTWSDGNVFLDSVVHKTFLSLSERGTRAGAATAATYSAGSSLGEYRFVYLDHPFVYLLIETDGNTPLFVGVLNDPAE